MRTLELLAPARNIDIGIAAIDCGADAVYIAGPAFGARQAAGNSIEDIRALCTYAHRFGARIFAAFNTIIYDHELDEAFSMAMALKDAGADALIVQDPALTRLIDKEGFGIPVHASTQCAIRTAEDAMFYSSLGFSRLILERELSVSQIKDIRNVTDCELEFFVHGALCVCYSGQCYMSEYIDGRSANRGACIQACRSKYDLTDLSGKMISANRAHLSLKDLNLKDKIEDLADAGICSFKIEGRLKNISYVKNIVREYSNALDKLIEKRPGEFRRASFGKVRGGFTPIPEKTFNRGYTELYIAGKRGDWACPDAAKSTGEEIGTVSVIDRKKNLLTVKPAGTSLKLNNGDGFCIIASKGEIVGFRGDICSGYTINSRSIPENIRPGQKIFRNIDTAFEKELDRNIPERKISISLDIVSGSLSGECQESIPSLMISATSEDGRTIRTVYDGATQKADNAERMKSLIANQLSKSTDIYSFTVNSIVGDILPFVPVSGLNALRRQIAERIDAMPCKALQLMTSSPDKSKLPDLANRPFTYKSNIANRLSREIIENYGGNVTEKAYELTHRDGAELMRTKYCIRYQYGLCPKYHSSKDNSDLLLVNNGRKFVLSFDCARCEMTVKCPESRK